MEIDFNKYLISLHYDDISFGYQCVKRLPFMTQDGLFDVTNNIDVLYFNDMMSDDDIVHTSSRNIPSPNSILYSVDKDGYCMYSYNIERIMSNAIKKIKKDDKNFQKVFRRFFVKENKVSINVNSILDHEICHELILDGHECEYKDYIYSIRPISFSFTIMCMDNEPSEESIKEILDAVIKVYPFRGYTIDKIHNPVLERVIEVVGE